MMAGFEETCLPQVKDGLTEVFGADLAESLVSAALGTGDTAVNRQLLINDGLNSITPEQRAKALELLDIYSSTMS
ncbi:hypothetical protein [Curvivirga sp.]|uniref:hypothetical protein n=1 Tax=Curvivirga sp. TaxID=2856848 RepID=UPI003B5C9A76